MAANTSGAALPDLSGQRVLITGGLGFIGSNLAHQCAALGAAVTIYDLAVPGSGANFYNLVGIENRVRVIQEDTRDAAAMGEAVQNQDVLFHCAAHTSHATSMRDPLIDVDVNCRGVITVLEATRRFNPRIKFVHVGTTTQIGRMRYSPIDENHPEFPVDIYSANKTASEKYVLIYGSAYGIPVRVVRLGNTFGPRANIKNPALGFVNYFVGLALQNKPVTVYGTGEQLRNVSYVEDSTAALILASQSEAADGEVFFATGDLQYSVAQIAEEIVRTIGAGRVELVDWPDNRQNIDVGDAVVSNAKIKRVLGWTPRYDLSVGLARTRDYFTACLDYYLQSGSFAPYEQP